MIKNLETPVRLQAATDLGPLTELCMMLKRAGAHQIATYPAANIAATLA
ncbi:MAG: hypothetical protein ACRDR6_14975 [Pseudonocardiaceae bacterium]